MLGGGMIYALSNDQKLSRQALQELRESDGTSWSTASEQGPRLVRVLWVRSSVIDLEIILEEHHISRKISRLLLPEIIQKKHISRNNLGSFLEDLQKFVLEVDSFPRKMHGWRSNLALGVHRRIGCSPLIPSEWPIHIGEVLETCRMTHRQ